MIRLKDIKGLYVHGGEFHADDVCVAAFLELCLGVDTFEIVRGFSPPDDEEAQRKRFLVADIGDGMFDHHSVPREIRRNEIPYAAFGKVVRAFWEESGLFSGQDSFERFDRDFVQELDLLDNDGPSVLKGVKQHFCSVISSLNPSWNDENTPEIQMQQFKKATVIARIAIEADIHTANSAVLAEKIVRDHMKNAKDGILVLNQALDYQTALAETDIKWVIMPSLRSGWNVISVMDREGKNKALFPVKFRGKRGSGLAELCPGMEFCHASGFMAQFETKELALQAMELLMDNDRFPSW